MALEWTSVAGCIVGVWRQLLVDRAWYSANDVDHRVAAGARLSRQFWTHVLGDRAAAVGVAPRTDGFASL